MCLLQVGVICIIISYIPYYPIFHHQIAHNFQALTNCFILIGSDNYNRHCHTKCVDNAWTDLTGCWKSFDRDGGRPIVHIKSIHIKKNKTQHGNKLKNTNPSKNCGLK